MAQAELDLRERRVTEVILTAKMPVRIFAAELGRHRSRVYREIKRNGFGKELPYPSGYYGMVAQKTAAVRRSRRCKLMRLPDLREAVVAQLEDGWSPEQIAGRLLFEDQSQRVSHETIYA